MIPVLVIKKLKIDCLRLKIIIKITKKEQNEYKIKSHDEIRNITIDQIVWNHQFIAYRLKISMLH